MSYRILVADDSATIQKVIKIAFARYDVEIAEASSFVEALGEVSRGRPDVIVVDAALTGSHGPEDFRRLGSESGAPMLLLVGSYEGIDEGAFRSAGFEHFIKKPFESQDIVKTVTKVIGRPIPAIGATTDGKIRGATDSLGRSTADTGMATTAGSGHESGAPEANTIEAKHADPSAEGRMAKKAMPGGSFTSDHGSSLVTDPRATAAPTSLSGLGFVAKFGDLQAESREFEAKNDHFLPPQPLTDERRRGQRAFGAPSQPGAILPPVPAAGPSLDIGPFDHQLDTDPGLGLRPGSANEFAAARQPSQEVPPRVQAQPQATLAPTRAQIEGMVIDLIRSELSSMVREAVESYCARHFPTLAREVITAELRRLADEKARHLVDN